MVGDFLIASAILRYPIQPIIMPALHRPSHDVEIAVLQAPEAKGGVERLDPVLVGSMSPPFIGQITGRPDCPVLHSAEQRPTGEMKGTPASTFHSDVHALLLLDVLNELDTEFWLSLGLTWSRLRNLFSAIRSERPESGRLARSWAVHTDECHHVRIQPGDTESIESLF